MPTSRRSFLKALGLAGALPMVPGLGRAFAQSTAAFSPPYKILEIFLAGGASHRDSIFCDPDSASASGYTETAWPDAQSSAPTFTDTGYLAAHTPGAPTPYGSSDVGIGPCGDVLAASPLWNRTRALAMRHDIPAHEAATHLAITGWRQGRPRAAGVGAAVQANSATPVSWVLSVTGALPPLHPFLLTGAYGGVNAPIQVPILAANGFLSQLNRGTPPRDALVGFYEQQYRDGLTPTDATQPVRSVGYEAYHQARVGMENASQIRDALLGFTYTPRSGSPIQNIYTAGSTFNDNRNLLAIQLAHHLLTNEGAQYVGIHSDGVGVGYDTHGDTSWALHAHYVNRNLANILDALATLNLNDTLVAIYSEFGRHNQAPYDNNNPTTGGTGHSPSGYGALLLGGPINGCSVGGALSTPDSGAQIATGGGIPNQNGDEQGFHPVHLQAAIRYSAGIDPFDTLTGFDTAALRGLSSPSQIEEFVLGL